MKKLIISLICIMSYGNGYSYGSRNYQFEEGLEKCEKDVNAAKPAYEKCEQMKKDYELAKIPVSKCISNKGSANLRVSECKQDKEDISNKIKKSEAMTQQSKEYIEDVKAKNLEAENEIGRQETDIRNLDREIENRESKLKSIQANISKAIEETKTNQRCAVMNTRTMETIKNQKGIHDNSLEDKLQSLKLEADTKCQKMLNTTVENLKNCKEKETKQKLELSSMEIESKKLDELTNKCASEETKCIENAEMDAYCADDLRTETTRHKQFLFGWNSSSQSLESYVNRCNIARQNKTQPQAQPQAQPKSTAKPRTAGSGG